jgi:transposase
MRKIMSLRDDGMGDGTMSTRGVSETSVTSQQQSAKIARLEGRVRVLKGQCAQLRVENRTLMAENAAAERRIRKLEAEVACLTAELTASQRAGKRQAAPFSKGPPKTNPRRPGRKPGKAYGRKAHRRPPPPDQIDECYRAPLPHCCPFCQGAVKQDDVRQQFQVEFPRRPIYRRLEIAIGHCQRCGRRLQGRHPLQTSDALGAAATQLGPMAQASIVWLNKRLGLSHGKIADLFHQLFGIPLSRGGSAQVVLRAARRCKEAYAQIRASVRRSPWLANDETGWKIGGHSGWLHVVVGDEATCFTIAKQRSASVQARLVGSNYSGTMTHDGYSSYNRRFGQATHQQCLSHLMRRLEKMLQTARGPARRFPQEVLALAKHALALRDQFRTGQISEDDLADWYLGFLRRLETLVERPRSNAANRQLAKHLRKHIREWFWFLLDPMIDATNYRAEQALRFGVTNRKVWGGNRTAKGKDAQAILMSVMETVRRQGRNPLDALAELLRNKSPPARHDT